MRVTLENISLWANLPDFTTCHHVAHVESRLTASKNEVQLIANVDAGMVVYDMWVIIFSL